MKRFAMLLLPSAAVAMAPLPPSSDNPLDKRVEEEDQEKGRACAPWDNGGRRVRWFWLEYYNDYIDDTQEPFLCLKAGKCLADTDCDGRLPPNGCIEKNTRAVIRNITDATVHPELDAAPSAEEILKLGLSKRVLFSAFKMARESGDLINFQWIHGLQPNAVVNHFTAFFLPWHRKYQLEYENVLRAQWKEDPDCPGCRKYYSCITSPAWNWADDQSTCEAARAGVYNSDVSTTHEKSVNQPFQRAKYEDGNQFNGAHTMGLGCNTYAAASQFVHDFGGTGSAQCSTSPYCKYSDKLTLQGGPMCKDPSDPDVQAVPDNSENATHAVHASAAWGPINCQDVAHRNGKPMFPQEKLYTKGFTNNPYDTRIGCVATGPFAGWTFPTAGLEPPNIDNTEAQNCISRATDFSINDNNEVFTSELGLAQMIQSRDRYSPTDWSQDGLADTSNPNSGFRLVLESVPHGVPHTFIGGHMASYESIADPMFLGHHSMIDATFELWQDCHDLSILSSVDEFNPKAKFHPKSIEYYHAMHEQGRKGVLRSEIDTDWRGRHAYGAYVEQATGRYGRGNNYGIGGHAATTFVNLKNSTPTLSPYTSATKSDGPYTSATSARDGLPSSTDHYPMDTAWPNYKPKKKGVILDGDIEEDMMFAFPNTSVVNHCFLGPQYWTPDGLEPKTGAPGNNKCYECVLKQGGPNGNLAKGGIGNYAHENDCRARGFDTGQDANEDYCQMFCGMPECEEVCGVHHHAWGVQTDQHERGANDPNVRYDHPTTRRDLRTYDEEHTRVADYMDPQIMPAYDVVTKQHYFANVQYSTSGVTKYLEASKVCAMDHIFYGTQGTKDVPKPKPNSVADLFEASFAYSATSPLADSEIAAPVIGKGTLQLTEVVPYDSETYTCSGSLVGADIGCSLKVKDGTCRIRKSLPFLTTSALQISPSETSTETVEPQDESMYHPAYLINFEMINEDCSGVEMNVWHYKYQGLLGPGPCVGQTCSTERDELLALSYTNLSPASPLTGTVIRVQGHYTDKAAGSTPWTPGTGFTETTAPFTTPYARGAYHPGGEVAMFHAFRI